MASPATVLVVEDDDGARAGLRAVLTANGYIVTTATDGQDALNRLASGIKPAVILLDMIMPILDGWRFMELRAEEPDYAAIPVIVVTGMNYTSYEWALSRGAVGVLHKPIDVAELLGMVKRYGERHPRIGP